MREPQQSIGVVGLGVIGLGLARNLLNAGYRVKGFDPNPATMEAFKSAGGQTCPDAAECAAMVSQFIVCVFDAPQALGVLDEALSTLETSTDVIVHTTMAPDEIQAVAERMAESGFAIIDAPVTGGKAGADAGTLTIMLSGPPAALARAEPVFEHYSQRRVVLGEQPGAATTVKMVNQLLNGVHMVVAAEAISFAIRAGADPQQTMEVITNGAANSRAFESRASMMVGRTFDDVRGALEIFTKDLGIVSKMAKEMDFDAALARAALARFDAAAGDGFAKYDCSSVVTTYDKSHSDTVHSNDRESK